MSHRDSYPHRKLDPAWSSPLAGCSLPGDDVHLWRGWLDQPAWRVQQLAQSLSADERMRADRFRFEADRKRFVVARGTLRLILSQYLGMEPGRLKLCIGPHGKPYLQEDMNAAHVRFSIAHSHQLAVYAFVGTREIGVDLEYACPMPHIQQTAAAFMSARELALLSALPTDRQLDAFYSCWTCKEAYVKATGMGLAQPLEQLDGLATPGKPARLLGVEGDPGEPCRWSLQPFVPAPGYVAALAIEGQDWHITCRDLATLRPPQGLRSMVTWDETALDR